MPNFNFVRNYKRNLHRFYDRLNRQKHFLIKNRYTIFAAVIAIIVVLLLFNAARADACVADGTTCTITYLSKNNDFDDNGGLSPGQCHNFTDEQGWFHKECLNSGTNFDIYMSKSYSFQKGKKYPKLYKYYDDWDTNVFKFYNSSCPDGTKCVDAPPPPPPTPTPPPPTPPPKPKPKTYRYSMIEKLRRRPFQVFNSAECIFVVIEVDDDGNKKFVKGNTDGLEISDYSNALVDAQKFTSLSVEEVSNLPTDYENQATKDKLFWKAQYIAPNCRNWKPFYFKI